MPSQSPSQLAGVVEIRARAVKHNDAADTDLGGRFLSHRFCIREVSVARLGRKLGGITVFGHHGRCHGKRDDR